MMFRLDDELVAELKVRGFPWHEPTLGYLIEACYPYFTSLVDNRNGIGDLGSMNFLANSWKTIEGNVEGGMVTGNGRTPEEALANLWLALNVKKYQ